MKGELSNSEGLRRAAAASDGDACAQGGVSVLFPLLTLPATSTMACEGMWVLCFECAENIRYISRCAPPATLCAAKGAKEGG